MRGLVWAYAVAMALVVAVSVLSAQEQDKPVSMRSLQDQVTRLQAIVNDLTTRVERVQQNNPVSDKEQRKANARSYRAVCEARGLKFAGVEVVASTGAATVVCR